MDGQPSLVPGSRMVVRVGDELIEDTIHAVRYESARPEIREQPTGWRKLLRNLTPARWRRSLPIVRPYQPARLEVVPKSDVARRAELACERISRTLDKLGIS